MSKFFDAIRQLFASLFGSSKPKSPQIDKIKAIEELPSDAAEVKADTIITTSKEEEVISENITVPDDEFEEDIFVDVPDEELKVKEETIEEPVTTEEEAKPNTEEVSTEEDTTPPVAEEETPPPPPAPKHKARYLWCLDNGHGKNTAGKRSPKLDDEGTRLMEYEFNRDIVARIIKQLDELGVQYYNVVPEVNVGNFLKERVARANKKKTNLKKIYLSIHSNAGPSSSVNSWAADNINGIETWHHHAGGKGKKAAAIFQKHLIEKTGFRNRHIKSQSKREFYVLRATNMPAILTENGFYNNKKEVKKLMKDEVRQQIADAHVAAILEIEKNGL